MGSTHDDGTALMLRPNEVYLYWTKGVLALGRAVTDDPVSVFARIEPANAYYARWTLDRLMISQSFRSQMLRNRTSCE